MNPPNITQVQRADFWSRVDIGEPDSCWLFTSGGKGRYGQFKINGHDYNSHVIAFFLNVGVWPVVRHTCDVKLCCNPTHLIDGTIAENNQDKMDRGRCFNGNVKGEHHVLSNVEVRRIRQLGVVLKAPTIANLPEFKGRITRGTIYRILSRELWGHLK